MNRSVMHLVVGVCLVGAVALSGCASKSASTATSALAAGTSLINSLGGMETVNALANSFGINLANNALVSGVLGAVGIDQAKQGLVNEIAKVSGMTPPNPGVDLMSVLSGKGLGAEGAKAVNEALSKSADELKIEGATKTALMGVLDPVTRQIAAQ